MTPKMWVCEYGQVHNQTKKASPVRLVMDFPCNSKKKHSAIAAAVVTQEIDHEVKVETLLYTLDTLSAKYDMELDLVIDLSNAVSNLREVLDHEAPMR